MFKCFFCQYNQVSELVQNILTGDLSFAPVFMSNQSIKSNYRSDSLMQKNHHFEPNSFFCINKKKRTVGHFSIFRQIFLSIIQQEHF